MSDTPTEISKRGAKSSAGTWQPTSPDRHRHVVCIFWTMDTTRARHTAQSNWLSQVRKRRNVIFRTAAASNSCTKRTSWSPNGSSLSLLPGTYNQWHTRRPYIHTDTTPCQAVDIHCLQGVRTSSVSWHISPCS